MKNDDGPRSEILEEQNNGNHSLYVTALVAERSIDCLIDSEATHNIIHPVQYSRLKAARTRPLLKVAKSLRVADGGIIESPGVVHLMIQIDHQELEVPFVIADIKAPVLLGMTFLRENRAVLDLTREILKLGDHEHKCHTSPQGGAVFRVTVAEDVVVPALSEIILPARVDIPQQEEVALLEGSEEFMEKYNLMVAQGVVSTKEKLTPVRIANLSYQPKALHRGNIIGTAELLEEDVIIDYDEASIQMVTESSDTARQSEEISSRDIPEHIMPIWNSCKDNLTDSQRRKVKKFLIKNSDVFSKSKSDLGRTKLFRHRINTGNHPPIKIRPRRMPPAKRKEGQAERNH